MAFLDNLQWRYATKSFDSSKKLSYEQISKILEAIKMAPSSYGIQPFHVLVITNPEIREKLKTVSYNQDQITSASHLLVFCANTDVFERVDTYFTIASGGDIVVRESMKKYEDMLTGAVKSMTPEIIDSWTKRQAYIALGFALAAAAELSIDSCSMEGFDSIAYKQILELPENLIPVVLLPLGTRAESEKIKPKVRFNDLFENIA